MKIIAKNGNAVDHRKVRRVIRHTLNINSGINKRLGASPESDALRRVCMRLMRRIASRPGHFQPTTA